ncbi:hypothetical protein BDF19DRAFT_413148 [Syncephalis fuscata]|nr:hypothetical protein BDF19DRAFT_413148 [Syncephalis fuscata]
MLTSLQQPSMENKSYIVEKPLPAIPYNTTPAVEKDHGAAAVVVSEADPLPVTTLMVCSKCVRRDLPDACTMAANCRVPNTITPPLLGDMEDLIGGAGCFANPSLMSARDVKATATDDPDSTIQIKTGRKLYHRLRARRLDKLSAAKSSTSTIDEEAVADKMAHQLRIVPVDCLSNCDRGNCIAITAPGKYIYQFGDLDERRPEVLDDIIRFTMNYMESADGFSKTKTRPTWMKSNVLARIPPLPMPSNIIPDWHNMEQEDMLEAEEIHRRVEQQQEQQEHQQIINKVPDERAIASTATATATISSTGTLVHRQHRHHDHDHHSTYKQLMPQNDEQREPCDCRESFV